MHPAAPPDEEGTQTERDWIKRALRRARVRLFGFFGRPIEVRHKLRVARGEVLRWVAFSAFLGMVTGALVAVFGFLLREEVVPVVCRSTSPLCI